MNEIKIFENPAFGAIRTVEVNNEPYFVGKDVAEVLGYAKPRNAIATHVDDEDKEEAPIQGDLGGEQKMTVINESGLYSLILSSKLPTAKAFKRWVTGEVLPSIRKHGAYMADDIIEQALASPDFLIQLSTQLKDEKQKNQKLTAQNSTLTVEKQIMQPKADYFDELVDRNLLTNFRDTAKQLGLKQNTFIKFLLERKYIYRDKKGNLKPHAKYAENGLFEVKESCNEKTKWAGTQTLITPKGRETFRLLCAGA